MLQFYLIGAPYQFDWNIRRIGMSLPKSTRVKQFGLAEWPRKKITASLADSLVFDR
jgi:hypothetical protein